MRLSPLLLALSLLIPNGCRAQQHHTVQRSDGHTTPLLVYEAEPASKSCAPLAVISHGAGGTEYGYRYLANFMASQGYTTIVMGHAESGPDALSDSLLGHVHYKNIGGLVADPAAEGARLLDLTATLKWADAQCHAPFRVLLGHSMGAETVLLESGMKNRISLAEPPSAQNRFDAYIALSPSGPGLVAPEHAWSHITKPMLILTGTRDLAVTGPAETRQIPWQDLPPIPTHCHWLGVIDDATHMNLAGAGPGADNVKPLVTQTIASFLTGVHSNACTLPTPTPTLKLQSK
jgi:dienelactone hydrolase